MKPFLVSSAATIVFVAILVVSAGRLSYWPAWAYAAIGLLTNALMQLILRKDPDLARERSKPGRSADAWDKKLLGIGLLLNLAMLVVAGLDAGRYFWSPSASWIWSAGGGLVPALLSVVLMIARTRLEDSVLEKGLEGYRDYQRMTPYRLAPGLW